VRFRKTVGPAEAAALCGISPQLLRARAARGSIRAWRRLPLRFRLTDVLAARERMRHVQPRAGRPRKLEKFVEEVLTA
jgi:hypothetical protein